MSSKTKEKRPPLWIIIIIITSVPIGIFTAVLGISRVENYINPYLFGLVFGGLGILIGTFIALKLKHFIAINQRLKENYFPAIFIISIVFFGTFLFAGSLVNQHFSISVKCNNYAVINKYRQDYRYRSPEINSLVVNLNDHSHRLICSYNYWSRTSIGQPIHLCIYKSYIGFDFIAVINDHN